MDKVIHLALALAWFPQSVALAAKAEDPGIGLDMLVKPIKWCLMVNYGMASLQQRETDIHANHRATGYAVYDITETAVGKLVKWKRFDWYTQICRFQTMV